VVAGFEGEDGGADGGWDFWVLVVILDEYLEASLFWIAVSAGFLVVEVLEDGEGCEFAGIAAFVGAE